MFSVFVDVRPSRFASASPTLLYSAFFDASVGSASEYDGFVTLPSASTVEPPPSESATLCAVACSCEPLIASVLVAVTAPAFTFVIVVPSVPFSVTTSCVALSYATASDFRPLPGSVGSTGATRPASCNWPRLIAS